MRMAKLKIGEFEEGDLASRGVRWQKWTALLEDNCDWFGVTEAKKKVKALHIYGWERVRDLVNSLPEPEMEGDAFEKTMAKLNAFFLPKKIRNRRLAKKSVRDRYSVEKLLKKAEADEEANVNELQMTAKEIQDVGKQDSDANVNRVNVRRTFR